MYCLFAILFLIFLYFNYKIFIYRSYEFSNDKSREKYSKGALLERVEKKSLKILAFHMILSFTLFFFLSLWFSFGIETLIWSMALAGLGMVFIYDFLYRFIYLEDLGIILILGLLINIDNLYESILSGFCYLLIMLIIYKMWDQATGEGDVYFAFIIGIFTKSYMFFYSMLFAYVLAGIYGIFLFFIKKENLKSEIPLASFMVLGLLLNLGGLWWLENSAYLTYMMKEFMHLK